MKVPKKKINKGSDIGFVPGIYNYCDRWCEKCQQQERCMSFVMGKKLEEKGGFSREPARENDNLWNRLKDVFESTYEVLHELAKEKGVEVEDIYALENIDKELWGDAFEEHARGEECVKQIEDSDIVHTCMIYENLADKCLEKIFNAMGPEVKKNEGGMVDEAIEIVNWYLDLIQAKMRRALYGFFYHKAIKEIEADDFNGSAKVALIAVERSLENWKIVQEYCKDFSREIAHLLVVLEQLRDDIEKQFPYAREFKRPGFEENL